MQGSPRPNWFFRNSRRASRLMLMAAATLTPILFATGCQPPPPVPTDAVGARPLDAGDICRLVSTEQRYRRSSTTQRSG